MQRKCKWTYSNIFYAALEQIRVCIWQQEAYDEHGSNIEEQDTPEDVIDCLRDIFVGPRFHQRLYATSSVPWKESGNHKDTDDGRETARQTEHLLPSSL